jgi:hypothetical protein
MRSMAFMVATSCRGALRALPLRARGAGCHRGAVVDVTTDGALEAATGSGEIVGIFSSGGTFWGATMILPAPSCKANHFAAIHASRKTRGSLSCAPWPLRMHPLDFA